MKKLLSIVLAVAMGCALAACGGSKPAETTAAPAATTAAAAAETTAAPAAPAAPAAAGGDFIMGTGSSGGTYFALGGAMANAINNKLAADGITITAQSTGASVENINLMQAGEMDLGIAMNNVAANGFEGTGAFTAPTTNVKAIGVVYNEVYQIVANAETGAKTVADLKGMKIAIGPAGSGTLGLSQKVFSAAGLDPAKDIQPQSDSFGDAATKMKDGHIQHRRRHPRGDPGGRSVLHPQGDPGRNLSGSDRGLQHHHLQGCSVLPRRYGRRDCLQDHQGVL